MPFFTSMGEHWKKIGFKSVDPAKELKSVGILGMWHLFNFFQYNRTIAKEIYQSTQMMMDKGFLIAHLCIKMTKWIIIALQSGRLNTLISSSLSHYNGDLLTFIHTLNTGLLFMC